MKIFAMFFVLAVLPQMSLADCMNISGVFESTNKDIVKRILTIKQEGCDTVSIKLQDWKNADIHKLDGVPYTYAAHSKDRTGAEIPNGLPIDQSLKDRYAKASISGNKIKVMQVIGWTGPSYTDIFKPEVIYQKDCSVTEIVYELADNNSLVETQNGYTYTYGNMIPAVINYKRVK